MNYLFVVAHPDDESDAAGGTIHKLVAQGHHVAVAIMVSQAAARRNLSETLSTDEEKAMAVLGVEKVYHAAFSEEVADRPGEEASTDEVAENGDGAKEAP